MGDARLMGDDEQGIQGLQEAMGKDYHDIPICKLDGSNH